MEIFAKDVAALWADPRTQWAWHCCRYLSNISGCFWLLSSVFGQIAVAVHETLLDELAQLFATIYNTILAMLFAAIMAVAVQDVSTGSAFAKAYQAGGFVFVYVALKIVYADGHELNEYAWMGFLMGLATYIVGAVYPPSISHPYLIAVFHVMRWMAMGWVGALISGYAAVKLVRSIARWGWDVLTFQRIRVRPHPDY